MPVPKPTTVPDWASSPAGQAQTIAPAPQTVLDGWAPGYRPPAQHLNWLFKQTSGWLKWVQDVANQAFAWTAAHVFGAAVTFNDAVTLNGATTVNGTLALPAPNIINLNPSATGWTGVLVRFWKDAVGMVHIEMVGNVTNPLDAHPFTMIAGYRPAFSVSLIGGSVAGGGAYAGGNPFVFEVAPDGTITVVNASSPGSVSMAASYRQAN